QHGDARLKREGCGNNAQPDRLAVGRQQPGNAEDRGNADHTEQLIHGNAGPPRPYQTMPWVAPAAASSSKLMTWSGVSPTISCLRRVLGRKAGAEKCFIHPTNTLQ